MRKRKCRGLLGTRQGAARCFLAALGRAQAVNVVCAACRKQREASRDDVSEALAMAEDELDFLPQAGATTSANAALTAAAMASARHRRQGPHLLKKLLHSGAANERAC